MPVTISIDDSAVRDLVRQFGDAKVGVMLQRAVSRTVTTGVALIARRIGEHVNLKIGDIKKTITGKRGSQRDPSGSITIARDKAVWLSQFLTVTQRRIRLKSAGGKGMFKQLQPKGGITVKVRKIATPKHSIGERLPHAFLAGMPKVSHVGIFERTGIKRAMKSGRYKGKVREVIRRRRGPTPLAVFVHAKGEGGAATVFAEVTNTLSDVLQKNVASQIDLAIRGPKAA